MRIPVMAICAVMLAAAPAFGASRKDHDNCNARDVDRNIAGCTRVLEDFSESARTRGIAYVGRGLAWSEKGDVDRAIADMTDAIRLNPNDSLAYSNRGILWREKKNVERAIADFTWAIRIDALPRSDIGGDGHVNIYTNRGLAYQAKGDLVLALSDFDEAIRRDRNDADAYFNRSKIHQVNRQIDRAIADLDQAIRLRPELMQAYYTRANARYERYAASSTISRKDDIDGAISDYSEVIRLDPTLETAYHARGMAWKLRGDIEHAVADFTEAVRLNPMNPDVVAALQELKPDFRLPSIAEKGILNWPEFAAQK
ncbi:tetratricopeptide repeat protein [Tardiphaga sp.]|uniref:tetratricopeptide repeat protein n=1 Tax=Tardiphaga sp. TaxID=1926292 RepID=UPI00262C712E|nr:tetratricopeptide repeat protein [Tardiphaga sp.]MDB5617113.1 tetratricopeptide repeat protein [Tardiphaga sp.]